MSKNVSHIKGKDKKGESVELECSKPYQISLFQQLANNINYSNTIELYDAIPKYYSSQQLSRKRENGKYLPVLTRKFSYRNQLSGQSHTYKVEIKPAYLKDIELGEKHYYPTEREEIVEEALRKLATEGGRGIYLNDHFGIQFTLYELRKELARSGHTMRLDSIIDALFVCNETHLEVTTEEGSSVVKSAIFPVLLMAKRKDWLKDPKNTKCYVQFNPLVTQSLDALTYRRHDYQLFMRYRGALTRWLHKRLFHNFVQAELMRSSYHLLASTIIADSGLLNAKRFVDNLKTIERALVELENEKLLSKWEKEIRYDDSKKRIVDAKYTMHVSHIFIKKMRDANACKKGIEQQAGEVEYLPSSTLLDDI